MGDRRPAAQHPAHRQKHGADANAGTTLPATCRSAIAAGITVLSFGPVLTVGGEEVDVGASGQQPRVSENAPRRLMHNASSPIDVAFRRGACPDSQILRLAESASHARLPHPRFTN